MCKIHTRNYHPQNSSTITPITAICVQAWSVQKFSRLFTFQTQRFKGYHARLADEIESFENIKILIVKARIYFYSCILVILNTVQSIIYIL